ncbi:Prp19/Pso4-like-domain-containing protein [Podospora fimiseda]|uniref:Pre-mRNA-processing factor 19 n=1 Tax=Podospora fimiseda TaxID=252190 RepID=A0AAN7BEY3_9PEZI|nr:Prp19/Pso4-like-domain-containing protein [Podospora fimiseda]
MSARVQGSKPDDKSLIQETYYRPALDRARGAPLRKTSNIQLQPLRTTLKMLCAQVPEEPVVSRKTGTVFEKRLILKYIEENGKEPGTDEELDPEDLFDLKTSRIDALVLDAYNTREQLARTREELATALYQYDAAVRVIARLTKERDEARDALSKVTVAPSAGGASNGDAMAVDNEGLPEALVEHVTDVKEQLTQRRREKRPAPEVASFQQASYSDLSVSQASTLDVQANYAAIGGFDGKVDIYSIKENNVERSLDIGEPVTATVWTGSKVILGKSKGTCKYGVC